MVLYRNVAPTSQDLRPVHQMINLGFKMNYRVRESDFLLGLETYLPLCVLGGGSYEPTA